MLFNSFHFFVFFPAVTAVYFIAPKKIRCPFLLAASYYFYMSWNAQYAVLIAASTFVTWLSGLLIGRCGSTGQGIRRKKLVVAGSFFVNLSILGFFKYFDFAIHNVNLILGSMGLSLVEKPFSIVLPVGISFYTFQALSYTVDVYRKDIQPEKNIIKYALFVSFSPSLWRDPLSGQKIF